MTVKTKQIFILIKNNGDGSGSLQFVIDETLIDAMHKANDLGLLDCENHAGVDGDGFHYTTLNVPETMTLEELGISEFQILNAQEFVESLDSEDVSEVFSNLNTN